VVVVAVVVVVVAAVVVSTKDDQVNIGYHRDRRKTLFYCGVVAEFLDEGKDN
jgi:hypothetical protein